MFENLTAAENIGRWQTELETAASEQAKDLHDLISQAQKAMHRNTARIESLEYTKAAIRKIEESRLSRSESGSKGSR